MTLHAAAPTGAVRKCQAILGELQIPPRRSQGFHVNMHSRVLDASHFLKQAPRDPLSHFSQPSIKL